MKLIKIGIYKKYNNKVWNLFCDSYHNGFFHLIYPKFQRNKNCLTKLCNVICNTQKMEFMAEICLTDPKFQHNKDYFSKLCIAICKSGPKMNHVKNIWKILSRRPAIDKQCHFLSKICSITQKCNITKNVLLNFGLSFAKAYQNMKSCQK